MFIEINVSFSYRFLAYEAISFFIFVRKTDKLYLKRCCGTHTVVEKQRLTTKLIKLFLFSPDQSEVNPQYHKRAPHAIVQSLNSPFFPPYIGAEPGRASLSFRPPGFSP